MLYSQKYCLVSFNRPLDVNTKFVMTNWPLHVTLADVFAVDLTTDLRNKLTALLAKQTPVTTTANKEAFLGETKVVLLDKNDKLVDLHNLIVDLLISKGATFNSPEFIRAGFLPHCTVQKIGRLNTGDRLKIDTITLVDMFPGGSWQQRKVLRNFKLQGTQF